MPPRPRLHAQRRKPAGLPPTLLCPCHSLPRWHSTHLLPLPLLMKARRLPYALAKPTTMRKRLQFDADSTPTQAAAPHSSRTPQLAACHTCPTRPRTPPTRAQPRSRSLRARGIPRTPALRPRFSRAIPRASAGAEAELPRPPSSQAHAWAEDPRHDSYRQPPKGERSGPRRRVDDVTRDRGRVRRVSRGVMRKR
eukprot:2482567-Rhodomonas_salina.2